MPSVDNVLIVGGGIAGLTTACALAQRGVSVELVELADAPVGAAIMINGRALDALDGIGVMQRFEAEGIHNPLGVRFHGPGGQERQSIAHYRPVFADILTERAKALGVVIRSGVGLTAISQDDAGVEAGFSDGSSGRYDIAVGADGIRSTVRSLVFGDEVQPLYAGQCNIRWMTPGEPVGLPGGAWPTPFGKLLSYPVPQNLIYGITVFAVENPEHVSMPEARKLLREQLAMVDDNDYIIRLRERLTDDIPLIYRPFEWLMMPGDWFNGRVILIGDAAHATTAHMSSGGGMAIEDAVVLAEELDRCSAPAEAFAAFMKRRLQRVKMVVDTSVALSQMEAAGMDQAEVFKRGAPAFAALAEAY